MAMQPRFGDRTNCLGRFRKRSRRSRQQAWFAMSFNGVDGNDSIAWRLRQAYHDELVHNEAPNDTTDSRLDLVTMIEETLAKIMYIAHQSTKDIKSILANGPAWRLSHVRSASDVVNLVWANASQFILRAPYT